MNAERRSEERKIFATPVDFAYNYAEHGSLACRTAVGVTMNLSGRGLGFYAYEPLQKSQAVSLFSSQLNPEPVSAEVRWCAQVSSKIYKVGLMFHRRLPEQPPAEEAPGQDAMPLGENAGASAGAQEDWRQAIEMLRAQMEAVEANLGRHFAELTEANERLRAISVLDDLTGVHNRRYFYERLEEERNLLNRYGHNLSLMLLDIDDFKNVNDQFGHMAGDALLREFSEVVKKSLRKGDIFTRYGGEEFAAILPHTGGEAALTAADNIRRHVEATRFISLEGKKNITVSIGVIEVGTDISETREALRRADEALYEAKRRGKNRAILWPPGKQ